MIDIHVQSETLLRIYVDEGEYFNECSLILASLLSAQYRRKKAYWTISVHDVEYLKQKMNTLNLIGGRTISDNALRRLVSFELRKAVLAGIKEGNSFPDLVLGKTEPYSDQLSGISFLTHSGASGAGIFDEMGIGKTLQLLYTALQKKGRVLVVCPNTVKSTWATQTESHTDLTYHVLPNGSKECYESLVEYDSDKSDILIVHPESLVVKDQRGKSKNRKSEVLNLLCRMQFDIIIVDEAHMIKHSTSKRHKAVMRIWRQQKDAKIFFATGTPVAESPLDAEIILRTLLPDAIPSRQRFIRYFVKKERKEGWKRSWTETTGYKNLRQLKELLEYVSIRRLKTDVRGMPEKLPPVMRNVFLSGKQLEVYDRVRRETYDKIVAESGNVVTLATAMTKIIRLRQILNHPSILGFEGESSKYLELDKILEEVLSNPMAKAVVWTEFVPCVQALTERYKKYSAVGLYSGTSKEQFDHLEKHFDTSDCRLVISIPKKGGTGIDFLSRARTAIYVDRPYSYTLFTQSVDRIVRRGKEEPKTTVEKIKASPASFIFLHVEGSVDNMVQDALQNKEDMSQALTTSDEALITMNKERLLQYLE